MVEEYLRHKGVRDKSEIELLSPLNRAFTIESASKLIQPIMEERGIGLTTFFNVEAVDPSAGVVESLEGEKDEYDLLVLVPPHKGAQVVIDSELGDRRRMAADRQAHAATSRGTSASSDSATRRTCRSRSRDRPRTSRRR